MFSLTIVLDEKLGGFAEFIAFALATVGLDLVELFHGVQELAGEAGGVEAKLGELVDGGFRGSADVGEDPIFELRDAVKAPGSVGEQLD